jgi:light-harvesting complex 1 beta chain
MAHSNKLTPQSIAVEASRGFGIIFAISFIVFLAIALFGQLTGWDWRSALPGAEGGKSVLGGVKASVYTFMSHLL